MEKKNPLEALRRLGRKLEESGIGEVAEIVLGETPVGKVARVVRGIGKILGKDTDDPDEVAEMLEGATAEQRAQILEFRAREVEAAEETKRAELSAITARHASDIMGDTKLTKTIRPIVTYMLLALVAVDVTTVQVGAWQGRDLEESKTLQALMEVAIAFYFGSRGLQHIAYQFARRKGK